MLFISKTIRIETKSKFKTSSMLEFYVISSHHMNFNIVLSVMLHLR